MKKTVVLLVIGILIMAIGTLIFLKMKKSNPSSAQVVPVSQNTPEQTSSEPVIPEPPKVDRFPHDKDEDGLEDTEEEKLGLSDNNIDTDGDGLSDYKELNVFKTDPKKKDSDGDGFADGYEVMKGYNPLGPGKFSQKQ